MNNDFNDIFDKEQLRQNPFKVPEGYFDTLNKRIMENVARQASTEEKSEKPAQAKNVRMHVLRWAAACACVLVIGVSAVLFTFKDTDTSEVPATAQQSFFTSDDAFNQAADYTMLDNHDMYQMLAEE